MTNRQENKNSMYYAVNRTCDKHTKVWEGLPAYATASKEFKVTFNEIQDVGGNQMINITGIAENKQKEEEEMINLTLFVGSGVFAYASVISDHELQRKVQCSPSGLKRMTDTELRNMCNEVFKAAVKVVDLLADYGVTMEDVKQLQKEIDDYAQVIAAPRDALITRAKATARLEELFDQADKILKEQMDKLMIMFKTKAPDFYNEYFNARKIVDLGIRHEQAEELNANA